MDAGFISLWKFDTVPFQWTVCKTLSASIRATCKRWIFWSNASSETPLECAASYNVSQILERHLHSTSVYYCTKSLNGALNGSWKHHVGKSAWRARPRSARRFKLPRCWIPPEKWNLSKKNLTKNSSLTFYSVRKTGSLNKWRAPRYENCHR